ncbi:FAD-binding FR-type domain-containing protein [Mycena indigotica]|uniref:FAD-binding FR-type domain-containing protein n=1 Tax=Mycena indigotica TaxID=2126181 RepID=A0A8H6SDG5_9AGAR|nr:FAD-binding FR-type domain-containing protein [Mycena indigotica]KAF7297409.1 FAD-binding FR-type domain-containing protein [Mycena indigotica]
MDSDVLAKKSSAGHLQRNKTERRRLQGLQRVETTTGGAKPKAPQTWGQSMSIWMINEGNTKLFFVAFLILHLIAAIFAVFHYSLKDNLTGARATFGPTFVIARSAALVIHIDVIYILLPVCRNFVSLLRRTPLASVIAFDENITLHKATGWSILIGSVLMLSTNLYRLTMADTSATTTGERVKFFVVANFIIGPLWTGWLMLLFLGIMVYYAMEKRRRIANGGFEKFWYTHHLFIPFFILWQLHGMFCMIKPDRPPFCSYNTIGVFWRYWIVGGIIWISERVLREVRSRHVTYLSKVIQHPSNVMELQIKKEKTKTRAGEYIFINCPEISYFQWHPFTLTSAPQEDYISVHIRVEGDFTTALAKAVGCNFDKKDKDAATVVTPALNRPLPRIMVDGPFGTCSEEFMNYETVLLVGAGIGVTPFASILKTIWYRLNNFGGEKATRLSKVYFTWVIRDFGTAEWFHSLLHAIETQDTQNRIEINIYLTQRIKEDDMNNIIVHDVGAEKDAITSLRAPTHFGRPNWDRIFGSIAEKHPESDVGVFFCGPAAIAKALHTKSNEYSDPKATRFFFGKENF